MSHQMEENGLTFHHTTQKNESKLSVFSVIFHLLYSNYS